MYHADLENIALRRFSDLCARSIYFFSSRLPYVLRNIVIADFFLAAPNECLFTIHLISSSKSIYFRHLQLAPNPST